MDNGVPMSQMYADEEDLVSSEESKGLKALMRAHATAGKRPRTFREPSPEEVEQDQPDLPAYFAQWEMPDKHIILMCRSYASYLAAKAHGERK